MISGWNENRCVRLFRRVATSDPLRAADECSFRRADDTSVTFENASSLSGSMLCLKSRKSHLDTVSTGSGSDLVSDQQAIFITILDSH